MIDSLPSAQSLAGIRILVIGDLMVDRYLYGQVSRVSQEAPVPVVKLDQERAVIGGAGNVVHNLAALGSKPITVGVVGDDGMGRLLREELQQLHLDDSGVFVDPQRPTTIKTRVISQVQQIIRLDRESSDGIEGQVLDRVMDYILSRLDECDAVLLSDYDKGVLPLGILRKTIEEARKRGLRVFVDPKGHSFEKYRDASFIKPNRAETEKVAGAGQIRGPEDLRKISSMWIDQFNLEGLLISLGKDGLFAAAGKGEHFQSLQVEAEKRGVYDAAGAGDTVLAAFSLFLTAGLDVFQAARWANIAAGVVCGKSGVATTTLSELKNYAERFEPWQRKVKTLEELQQKVQEERLRGHRVIFTNGCFDLIHVGHIQLLQAARALGDLLIVGINSDESVHEIKGEGRPLIPGKERLQILASLDCVDYLSVYSGSTPNEMIQALRPDVLVKGGNYSPEEVTGHEIVENYGGRVELIRIKREVSVSGLVDHIVQRFGKEIS